MSELKFDFGPGFRLSSERAAEELQERIESRHKPLRFGVPYLDDALYGIASNDLILIGAETGTGKTDFATNVALTNSTAGARVHYFALEAEDKEIERRIIYSLATREMRKQGKPTVRFAEWRMSCDTPLEPFVAEATAVFVRECKSLSTYYRAYKFGTDDLQKMVTSINNDTDLIIIDHLNYIDIEDTNEYRGVRDLVKALRDMALGIGTPVLLVSHLRKRDRHSKSIGPSIDDFFGSSETAKMSTRAILLSPARCMRSDNLDVANTFIQVVKDRYEGARPYFALASYGLRSRRYGSKYTLGYENDGEWEEIPHAAPSWAASHVAYSPGALER